MSNARNLANLLESDGDIKVAALDNAPAPTKSTIDALGIAATSLTGSQATAITNNATTAGAALPKAGGALTGAVTTNSTFDGVDIATRDGVLTSTTATAAAALPKAGGTMTGDVTFADNIYAKFGTGNDLRIRHDGSNSYIAEMGTGNLIVQTNGADFLVENTDGDNMINAISDGAVELSHNNAVKLSTTATGVAITGSTAHTAGDITNSISSSYKLFGANGTAGSTAYVTYAFEGDDNTGMYHPAADTVGLVTAGAERMRIDSGGNVTVSTGNLVIGTNGKGIDFSSNADSSATGASTTSELLDDYEEGTWTPVVQGAAGNPSSITFHTAPSGRYTKIGRQVTISFYLHINVATGGSGNFQIHGVPFTAGSGSGGFSGAVSLYYADASLSDPVLKIDSAAFLSIICASGTGGFFSDVTWASAQLSAVATGTAMAGTLTYFV